VATGTSDGPRTRLRALTAAAQACFQLGTWISTTLPKAASSKDRVRSYRRSSPFTGRLVRCHSRAAQRCRQIEDLAQQIAQIHGRRVESAAAHTRKALMAYASYAARFCASERMLYASAAS